MQFEAEKPTYTRFTSPRGVLKNFVLPDAAIVANGKGGGVHEHERDAAAFAEECFEIAQQKYQNGGHARYGGAVLELNEAIVRNKPWKRGTP